MRKSTLRWCVAALGFIAAAFLFVGPSIGQGPLPNWQTEIRKYVDAQDWDSAMRIIIQQNPDNAKEPDLHVWRARVLTWSGRLAEAEKEYLELLKASPNDPDYWMALSSIYSREGRTELAERSIDTAIKIDAKRADLHAARGRTLRAAGAWKESRLEFAKALNLDPASLEARAGLHSLRMEPRHELRLGEDNDLFNFAAANRPAWMSLVSHWAPEWTTSIAASFYERGAVPAGKFLGSVTRQQPKWGALTLGGAIGHDNAVIPKSEAFFGLDHGWQISRNGVVRGLEFAYEQHWYWYTNSRILALNGNAIIYLPRECTLLLGATGSRSVFSGTSADWRPSELLRLAFPLSHWGEKIVSGTLSFAAGTEDFAKVDQIGGLASQTYGSGLRFQFSARHDVTGFATYQKRTYGRTDTTLGLSYGIHF